MLTVIVIVSGALFTLPSFARTAMLYVPDGPALGQLNAPVAAVKLAPTGTFVATYVSASDSGSFADTVKLSVLPTATEYGPPGEAAGVVGALFVLTVAVWADV